MHHFVVKFSKKNFASGGKGAVTAPFALFTDQIVKLTKILWTFLPQSEIINTFGKLKRRAYTLKSNLFRAFMPNVVYRTCRYANEK